MTTLHAVLYTASNDTDTDHSVWPSYKRAVYAGGRLARQVWAEHYPNEPFPDVEDDEAAMDAVRGALPVRLEVEPVDADGMYEAHYAADDECSTLCDIDLVTGDAGSVLIADDPARVTCQVCIAEARAVAEHPEHEECADGCGLAVTHTGPCLTSPGGRVCCSHEGQA